jgi:hypothetical protein
MPMKQSCSDRIIWEHNGCNLQNQNNIYPCTSTSTILYQDYWTPIITTYTYVQLNENQNYILAVVVYNNLFVAVHMWNPNTNELLHSFMIKQISPTANIKHIHLIEQQSIVIVLKKKNLATFMSMYIDLILMVNVSINKCYQLQLHQVLVRLNK